VVALVGAGDGARRARLQVGLAEALYRAGRGADAIRPASEALDRLMKAGLNDDARQARYWLAAAHHQADNPGEARILLEEVLAENRADSPLDPDLHMRLLMALAAVATQAGDPKRSLALLEEARGIGADVDDRRRATLFASLAFGYRSTGDMEAAIRHGTKAVALFRAADAIVESAAIANELALTYLELGNLSEARKQSFEARAICEQLKQDFLLAHTLDTEARIAHADGDPSGATALPTEAGDVASRTGNQKAEVSALLTQARAARAGGDQPRASEILESAAALARSGPKPRLREILSEWSELLAETGDHQRAYALSREALALV
jgi:tetratricopeptide (TPR) repeat protein